MTLTDPHQHTLAELLLALADDKLMLGHRNSDWTGLGPILEEDIAFSSLAQDEIAHAQAIYAFVGAMVGRDENELAFGRAPEEYRCARIVEHHDDFDWAVALVRQLLCDHFDALRLTRLSQSSHKPLADLARRLAAEEQVHVEHAESWIRRLGRGTQESHDRLQRAVDRLAPQAAELFEPVDGQADLEQAGLYPPGDVDGDMFEQWRDAVTAVLNEAGLSATFEPFDPAGRAGRCGAHSPALTELLDEMCEVYRTEPGAAW